MREIVEFEVELSASVGGFSVNFCGLMTRTSRKGITLSDSVSIVNFMEGLKLVR
jgi:hypothetical protein